MEENMATPDIKRAFRGVDTAQVDETFSSLAEQISSLEQSIAERNRTIQRLKKDIADPASASPSYSKLGSAFEQTLRTAEEQARRLRNDAAVAVSEIGNSTDIDVHNLTEKTEREKRHLIDAANALAKDLRLQIDRETAAATQQLEDERARMETNAARANRTAASLISQAEQQLSDVRAAAHREIAEITRRAAEIVQVASDNKVNAEIRIGLDVSDAQARSTALHDEADAFAQQAYEQADAHVDGVIAQSEALKQEADDYLLSAQIRADQILQDSRGLVQKSVSDAMTRSSEIAQASDEFFADFVLDAESSISEVSRNKLALTNYAAHIRGVSHDVNVDAIEAGPARGMRSIQQAQIVEDDK
jgi:chromosome segregation ATPase